MFSTPNSSLGQVHPYPLLIKQLLLGSRDAHREQEIVYRDRRHTYATFNDRVGKLARALSEAGVVAGDTVAVMDWDSHRYLECYFAVPMMGAVLMTANVRLSPEQITYTLNHSGAKVLLIHSDFLDVLRQIRPGLESVKDFILLDDSSGAALPDGFLAEYESMIENAAPMREFPDMDENSRATIFYTSGTTGLPKGVYFTHRQLVLHTLGAAIAICSPARQGRVHRDSVYMPMTPLFHVHAWGMPYVATMLGLKQVYPGRYIPGDLIDLIVREGVTFSHCVPTILHMLLSHPSIENADLSGLTMVIGGSALPRGLTERAMARGIDVFTGYGMSETGPIVALAQVDTAALGDPDRDVAQRTRTGTPVPLVDVRIVDEQMRDVAHDDKETGEIVIRAPWLTDGYFRDEAASGRLWVGGYLHTNDIAAMAPNGSLRITDRMKDVIKTGGEWISSLEVEDLISRHPSVSEVAVIGVPDERWGERPLALIVSAAGHAGDATAIRDHLSAFAEQGVISRYAVPERVLFVQSLEKTSIGKLDKKKMRSLYAQPAT